jgi:hypothetical protein
MYISISLLAGFAASAASAASGSVSLTSSDQPVPQFDLPNAFPSVQFVADPFDLDAIRNTLALYPLAVDGKNFQALGLVFATNAVANYSTPLEVLTPLSVIESSLEASLAPVTTQHSFGTQVIDVLSPSSATSVTYYTATHFGQGQFAGQILTAYGQYQDVWGKQKDLTWKITHRNLVFMVRCSELCHLVSE